MDEAIDATLTKLQKNRILGLVTEYGPPPNHFRWSEKTEHEWSGGVRRLYQTSVLTHFATGYYCIFGAHEITISPGWNKKIQAFDHEDKANRKEDICGKWLIVVKMEVETPDLWASIGQEVALPN